jgi:zinc/manganese transport system ATP-binding protein
LFRPKAPNRPADATWQRAVLCYINTHVFFEPSRAFSRYHRAAWPFGPGRLLAVGRGCLGAFGMKPAALELADLTVCYGRRPAVHHISGRFAPGSLTAIVGPNGAGKSTLLRALAGLQKPESGRIAHEGRARIALLPQLAALDRAFPIACRDVVMQGLWPRIGAFRAVPAAEHARVDQALAAVGLAGLARRPVGSLSAGQLQRLLFARLLVQDAEILLLDEPFNAVDAKTAADLLRLIRQWHGEGRTVIAVLHDLDLVDREFPETLLLARDLIAWGPTAQALSPANRLKARQMAEGWVEEAEACERAA